MHLRRAARPASFALRSLAFSGLVASLVGAVACVETKGAMDDYFDRTATLRAENGQTVSDASTNTNADAFKGDYLVLCLAFTKLPQHILRFRAEVDFAATGPGEGPISMRLQPLKGGTRDLTQTVGDAFPATAVTSPVASGKFVSEFGNTPDLDASTNPLTGLTWGIDGLTLRASLLTPPERFCANLEGKTRPSGLDVKGTVCNFYSTSVIPAGDPELSEYSCPQ